MKQHTNAEILTFAAILAFILIAAGRRSSTQVRASLDTVGEIQPVSVQENGQGVSNGYPALIRIPTSGRLNGQPPLAVDRSGAIWLAADARRCGNHPDAFQPNERRLAADGPWSFPPASVTAIEFRIVG